MTRTIGALGYRVLPACYRVVGCVGCWVSSGTMTEASPMAITDWPLPKRQIIPSVWRMSCGNSAAFTFVCDGSTAPLKCLNVGELWQPPTALYCGHLLLMDH